MPEYQIYAFAQEGSPRPSVNVTALTGEDALSMARMIVGDDRAAVWQGVNYVGRINFPDQLPGTKERVGPAPAR